MKLESGTYTIGALSVKGVLCIQPSNDEGFVHLVTQRIDVESGATFTVKSLTLYQEDPDWPWDDTVLVADGATFYFENVNLGGPNTRTRFTNYGTGILQGGFARPRNFGTMIWRGGRSEAHDPDGAIRGIEERAFLNEGWALLDQIYIESRAEPGPMGSCGYGNPVANRNGGVLTLARVDVRQVCEPGWESIDS